MQEPAHPAIDLAVGVGVVPLDRSSEVGHFLRIVGKRVVASPILEHDPGFVQRDVLESDVALDSQASRLTPEVGDGDRIVEDVVDPSEPMRLGFDHESGL